MNTIDKNFYTLVETIKSYDKEALFEKLKQNFLSIPKEIQQSLQDYFIKYPYWGKLNPAEEEYEEIENKTNSFYNHIDDYVWLYKKLKDYRSKKLLFAILNNWYQHDFETLKEVIEYTYPDYFDPDIIEVSKEEVIVDLGAYIGDTMLSYIELYGEEQYKKIYCYEITPETFAYLEHNLALYPNIECRMKAASDVKKVCYVKANPNGSSANTLTEDGNIAIDAVTIDEDIEQPITMIKMDIEGSEQQALIGCQNHIQASHPKLLISVYHNHEDLWKIPKMIDTITPDYEFYLRYHGGNIFPTEITLIAIDKKELKK